MDNPTIIIEEIEENGVRKLNISYKMVSNFKRMELLSNAVLNFIYSSTQGEFRALREQLKEDFIRIIKDEDFSNDTYKNMEEKRHINFN